MALFKPFRGTRAALDTLEKHDGYAYFCTDDGSFHIDYADADGNLQRKQISAKEAEKLLGYDITTVLNSSDTEIPTAKAVLDAVADKADANHKHDVIYLNALGALPASDAWTSVAYGNGIFVAIAKNSNNVAYSNDGMSWTLGQLPMSDEWTSIAYGGGYFVAVANYSTNYVYSNDGITWSTGWMPIDQRWSAVTYGNGIFVAIAPDNICAYGTVGSTFTSGSLPAFADWSSITFNGNEFVATSKDGNMIALSSDASYWSTSNYYNMYNGIEDITASSTGTCVAVGVQLSEMFYYSADGYSWMDIPVPYGTWKCITYGNGKFVALEYGSKRAMYSPDGQTWHNISLPVAEQWNDIIYGNGVFVAVANSSNVAVYSYDGINWNSKQLGLSDKDGNDIASELGSAMFGWTQIYDSGAITAKVNAISNINVADYKHLIVAIKSVNTTESASGISGAVIFEGENGQDYAFTNVLPNLIKNTAGTSGGMAIFKIMNGFIVCENAMSAASAEHMLSDTDGLGADNLTPVGSGVIRCTSPIAKMMVSNATLSSTHYYGAGSRVVIWGCKV